MVWVVAGLVGGSTPGLAEPLDIEKQAETTFPNLSDSMLVGVMVNNREVGSTIILRQDQAIWLPLEEFAAFSGATIETRAESMVFATPIGVVEIPPDAIAEMGGAQHISLKDLLELLSASVAFNTVEFALEFELPWRTARMTEERRNATLEGLEPDAVPPRASLSTFHSDGNWRMVEDDSYYWSSSRLEGRLLDGWWRVRYDTDFVDLRSFEEYAWLKSAEHTLFLAGYQRLRIHPLLDSLNLTGAQIAYTNQDIDRFDRSQEARQLLSRRMQSVETFRGPGPPGGLAELRVDGAVIRNQTIQLDGTFEFVDVFLPTGQANRIEVFVYNRSNLQVPVNIIEQTHTVADLLLKPGAVVHQGGLGTIGNLIDELNDGTENFDLGGFYQGRWGATRTLTIETAIQQTSDRLQILGGIVARLSPEFILGLGLATSDGNLGTTLDLTGFAGRWEFLIRSQWSQPGFHSYDQGETYDHFAEIGYSPSSKLTVSLIGRSRQWIDSSVDFIAPAIRWIPSGKFSLRGYPGIDGRYQVDAFWRPRPDTRVGVSVWEDQLFADLTHTFNPTVELSLQAEGRTSGNNLFTALAIVRPRSRWQPILSAGPLYSRGHFGAAARASFFIDPGFILTAEADLDPSLLTSEGKPSRRLFVGFSADLAFVGKRIVAGQTAAIRDDRGAVAGKVIPPKLWNKSNSLSGLTILLDGRRAATTDLSGSYFVGRVTPGLHLVELDVEGLPIELVPTATTQIVKVAGGGVTKASFGVFVEYGVAGRVTDLAGRNWPGVTIEVVDDQDKIAGSAVTDQFGLYRVDGLRPGSYHAQISGSSGPGATTDIATRSFEIADDYLFGQDLQIPLNLR